MTLDAWKYDILEEQRAERQSSLRSIHFCFVNKKTKHFNVYIEFHCRQHTNIVLVFTLQYIPPLNSNLESVLKNTKEIILIGSNVGAICFDSLMPWFSFHFHELHLMSCFSSHSPPSNYIDSMTPTVFLFPFFFSNGFESLSKTSRTFFLSPDILIANTKVSRVYSKYTRFFNHKILMSNVSSLLDYYYIFFAR